MTIIVYNNVDPKNKIGKTLSGGDTYTGALRNESSIINPVFIIEAANITGNYFYVSEFDRYYFIDNIDAVRTGLWRITGKVDVLESFKNSIKALSVILADTENTGADSYINNDVYITKVKTKTDIMSFPSGLSTNGTFVLITAGGQGGI